MTVTAATAKAVVAEDGSEKPSGRGCGPSQVRLFCEGPLCSRSRSTFDMTEYQSHLVFRRKESYKRDPTGRYNTKGNQYWSVLAAMP